ncbi:MAG: metal-dependent hydrolase [Neomegalonema sp.]|nr:metal-dependent hydrolase [Neomegalonema sp.]
MSTQWKITWLGHASFRLEVDGKVLLIDPWLKGNPKFDESQYAQVISGVDAILLTHAHFDHVSGVAEIAAETGAPVAGIFDLTTWLEKQGVTNTVGFNKGGTIHFGDVAVTMVNAVHSSSAPGDDGPICAGSEAGFMIHARNETLYVMGDTDVMADMALLQELHEPRYAIVPIGGHFTMDAHRAAYACKKFFHFQAVVPSHYKTFDLLAQNADEFIAKVSPVAVKVPEPMGTVVLG